MPSAPFLERLLDRMALRPSRHGIPSPGLTSHELQVDGRPVYLFQRSVGPPGEPLHVLKFMGSGGRAEDMTDHPFDVWDLPGCVWGANPTGYGESPGRASLRNHWATAVAAHRFWKESCPERMPLFTGHSLGGTVAICLAATVPCAGLIVRDMPPLKSLILSRYSMLPRIAGAFARHVPHELDVVAAAKECEVPAVFVTSQKDRVVPPACQQLVIDAYAGPKRVIRAEQSNHGGPLQPAEFEEYQAALNWLYASRRN